MERRRAHGGLANFALLACSCLVTVAVLEVAARIAVPQWRGLVAQNFMTATPGGVLAGVPNFDGRIASLFGEFDVPLQLDARGFRNLPDADPAAPLAFIGDSFCLGWGIRREQRMESFQLEHVVEVGAHGRLIFDDKNTFHFVSGFSDSLSLFKNSV